MIQVESGIVECLVEDTDDRQILDVRVGDVLEKAINYNYYLGKVEVGEKVYINTTAVKLGLGSGGIHFVLWREKAVPKIVKDKGHIMKCPYTPWQSSCLSVEEPASPFHDLFTQRQDLRGLPVVICELHSMMGVAAAVLKYIGWSSITYIMTDRACLPLEFSHIVRELRSKKIIDHVITIGNASGGDYEAINIYTALIAARYIAGAQVAIVSIGPGIIGTGTLYGFSTLEQGHYIDAVHALNGKPIFLPRISFADPRERHRGISHHSLSCLSIAAQTAAEVYVPILSKDKTRFIIDQIINADLVRRHRWHFRDGSIVEKALNCFKLRITTMGRNYTDDPAFFLVAGTLKNI